MNTLKISAFTILTLSIFLNLYGCSGENSINNSSPNSPNKIEAPNPIENTVYDVICFGSRSCISDISKVPRGTTVSLYTKKESSVQQGTKNVLYIETTQNKVGISEPEMESLAKGGANIYSFMNIEGCLSVYIYNSENKGFVQIEEKEYRVSFVTGNTTGNYKITNPACFALKFAPVR
jgi:hypothetical protein